MLGSLWLEISSIVEVVSVILAIPNNLLLLFCIFNKSPKTFGNYRYLMAFFTYQSTWFSIITLFLNVNYFTHQTSISIFVRRNLLGLPDLGMMILTCLVCSSNCMMFVALAVQFVYRYFAMTKNPNLSLFNSWRMSLWYAAMIFISICFGIITFICGYLMEGARVDGFRESLFSTFELPENSTTYYSRMTYYASQLSHSFSYILPNFRLETAQQVK
ncbi:hypothetical protein CRE_12414 [Caenorhabditis remanei]|uniref:Serpentine receptor class gamma n=1 Tax=Caenorhabditis remanei TaxID=31234 RepID=E3NQ40_CAERE|nr:hypothetical protein CRE_12414 [Caenorhabditis remanei]